jgi:CubicO group peptidase (beta-lactamase class C family)
VGRWGTVGRLLGWAAVVGLLIPGAAGSAPAAAPGRTLRSASAGEAGMRPEYADRLVTDAASYLVPAADHRDHPAYAGAVVLGARDGVIGVHAAVGDAVRYEVVDGRVVELPRARRVPMRTDTVFDIASVTKLFTAVVAMRQVERGVLDLDAPVARYLPEFAVNGKSRITLRQLLTHTAGLPEEITLGGYSSREAALAAVLETPLERGMSPGAQFHYSDLGLITLGAVVERVTGAGLDEVVRTEITAPLGMRDTGYRPSASLRERSAATEFRLDRGIVRGEAHDEKVAPLGGVAGHAGIFSTARDLAVFCQMLLNGGLYGTVRILRAQTVRQMLVNQNARFPTDDHGLGLELNQPWYMGPLASPGSFGHTGFTGTMVVVDPRSRVILILLTNQVHPDREWSAKTDYRNLPRRKLATDLARAVGL